MLTEGTRRFDLYDFFSVFVPGGAFLVGILPFLPRETPVSSTGFVGAMILLGFVFGRAIHALGLWLEGSGEDSIFSWGIAGYGIDLRGGDGVATSHRDYFVKEILEPNDISPGLVDTFYSFSSGYFDHLNLEQKRSDLVRADHEEELESLYTLVRSAIHMDARGRSRTFQAVLDFQRTMMMGSLLLFVIYVFYSIVKALGPASNGFVGYNTYISYLGLPWWGIFLGAVLVLVGSYTTFEQIRSNYRRYFVQYLMADFITLRESVPESNEKLE